VPSRGRSLILRVSGSCRIVEEITHRLGNPNAGRVTGHESIASIFQEVKVTPMAPMTQNIIYSPELPGHGPVEVLVVEPAIVTALQ
jgi:hypothetical protein